MAAILLSIIHSDCQQELHQIDLTSHLWNGVVLLILCFGSFIDSLAVSYRLFCGWGISVSILIWLEKKIYICIFILYIICCSKYTFLKCQTAPLSHHS